MGINRYGARRDANEKPIVEVLEQRGYVVSKVSGKGTPDLIVTKGGQMWLVEVKAPKGIYKPAQVTFHTRWTGPPIVTLRSVEDALKFPEVRA